MIKKFFRNKSRGQAIVLIVLMFTALIAIIGILSDGGMLLIEYARLKRAVDAASIASAQQFRKNFKPADLTNSAQEFLQLNQSDVFNVQTDTCASQLAKDPPINDSVLCTTPLRKLVRVTASRHVNFGFLRIIGINSTDITASAVGEAASIDLILVVDTSISMTAATNPNDPQGPNVVGIGENPVDCNPTNTCQPMADVKAIARTFAAKLFYPYDRVEIIAITGQKTDGTATRDPVVIWKLQSTGDGPTDQANVDNKLASLVVFQPKPCLNPLSSDNSFNCLYSDPATGVFKGIECPYARYWANPQKSFDPTTCNSTNGGGGLLLAGSSFTDPTIAVRKDSFWAVILLMSGTPNSSFRWSGDTDPQHVNGYCPSVFFPYPYCIQPSMDWTKLTGDPTRNYRTCVAGNCTSPANYSSLDYARDMADYVADPINGQGASIFTIGLGNRIRGSSTANGAQADEAERFLEYASLTAGSANTNHGKYYYAPSPSSLNTIFLDIYKNITTRISQ